MLRSKIVRLGMLALSVSGGMLFAAVQQAVGLAKNTKTRVQAHQVALDLIAKGDLAQAQQVYNALKPLKVPGLTTVQNALAQAKARPATEAAATVEKKNAAATEEVGPISGPEFPAPYGPEFPAPYGPEYPAPYGPEFPEPYGPEEAVGEIPEAPELSPEYKALVIKAENELGLKNLMAESVALLDKLTAKRNALADPHSEMAQRLHAEETRIDAHLTSIIKHLQELVAAEAIARPTLAQSALVANLRKQKDGWIKEANTLNKRLADLVSGSVQPAALVKVRTLEEQIQDVQKRLQSAQAERARLESQENQAGSWLEQLFGTTPAQKITRLEKEITKLREQVQKLEGSALPGELGRAGRPSGEIGRDLSQPAAPARGNEGRVDIRVDEQGKPATPALVEVPGSRASDAKRGAEVAAIAPWTVDGTVRGQVAAELNRYAKELNVNTILLGHAQVAATKVLNKADVTIRLKNDVIAEAIKAGADILEAGAKTQADLYNASRPASSSSSARALEDIL